MNRSEQIMIAFLTGCILDMIFGDPQGCFHPVRCMGYCIRKGERILRRCFPENKTGELFAGGLLVCLISVIWTAIPLLLIWGMRFLHPYLGILTEGLLLYQMFAAKSLRDESRKVYGALGQGLSEGRKAVSMIVGRDTEKLDEKGVVKAAVETVAENTSDGVIAPMLFAIVGGAPLAFFYKAVNTMDSMTGYKNDKYLYFGRAAAKLDDAVNFIPARLSALLMLLASLAPGFGAKNAWRIFRRDRKKHASPNSAQTEAVMAGALGVELAGNASYFGKVVEKPVIGDKLREIEREDILRADRLMYLTAFLGAVFFAGIRLVSSLR